MKRDDLLGLTRKGLGPVPDSCVKCKLKKSSGYFLTS